MFIYAEFELINMFLKEKLSKYKPEYALLLAAFFLFFLRVASERTVTGKFAGHLFNLMYAVCFEFTV